MAHFTTSGTFEPAFAFLMAAKCDFLSQNTTNGNLVYLIGSSIKYDLINLKTDWKDITKTGDCELKVGASMNAYNTHGDASVSDKQYT